MTDTTQTDDQKLRGLITKQIIEVMEKGEEVLNQKTGDIERKSPGASFIQAAIKWLNEMKRDSAADINAPGSEIEAIIRNIHADKKTGGELPEVDQTFEDAAS